MYSSFMQSIWPFIAAFALFIIAGIVYSHKNPENDAQGDTFALDIKFDIIVLLVITLIMHCVLVRYANLTWDNWYVTLIFIPVSVLCFVIPGGFFILNLILSAAGAAVIPSWMNIVALVLGCISILIYVILIRTIKQS